MRRGLSQNDLSRALLIRQATLSKLERRDNISVRSLRGFVQCLGGDLEMRARFDDETIELDLPFDPAPMSR
jgi:transcriptional regulator with XRE-family HTH domain